MAINMRNTSIAKHTYCVIMELRKISVRSTYILNTTLLTMLLAVMFTGGCADDQELLEQLDIHRERAAQLLVQHSQLREFMENELYELSDDVFITRDRVEDQSAVIFSDGKLIIPDDYSNGWYEVVKQYEQTIIEVFEEFNCVNISIFQPDSADPKKILRVVFDYIEIDDDTFYTQWLSYCRDGAVEDSESVFMDWYYSAWLLT